MLHARQLTGLLLVAGLAGALFVGSAHALPTPVMTISSSTADDPTIAPAPAASNRLTSTTILAAGPRIGTTYTLSEKRLATGRFEMTPGSSSERTRSKARFLKSGLLLAAMTAPIAFLGSRRDGASEADLTVATKGPADDGTSIALLGDGHGRGHDPEPGEDDDEECDTGDNHGDDGGVTPGDGDHHDGDDEPQGLPEPKTVLLIGTGLVTLLSFRNRR